MQPSVFLGKAQIYDDRNLALYDIELKRRIRIQMLTYESAQKESLAKVVGQIFY